MKRWKVLLPLAVAALAMIWGMAALRAQAGDGDGWLGVYIQNVDEDLADAEDLDSDDGVLINRVIDDSPADEAGLERGDIILEFGGKNVRSVRRLTRMIEWSDPGEEKELRIWRDGREKTITVEIGEDDGDDVYIFRSGDDNIYFHREWDDDDDDDWVHSRRDWDNRDFRIKIPDIDIDIARGPRAYSFSTGHLSTSHIGVSLYEVSDQLADAYGIEGGALINEVLDDSPAEEAGLRAGDVITKMDGRRVDDISEIREAIQEKDEDETIEVTILRDGSEKTIDVGIEESRTWSGFGSPRMRGIQRPPRAPRAPKAPRARHWDRSWGIDDYDDDRSDYRDAVREFRKEWRDEWRGEWREELREAMDELREGLEELREELEDLEEGG